MRPASVLALAALLVAGCGRKSQTIVVPGGRVTVTDQGGKVTAETPEGTVTATTDERTGTTTVEGPQGTMTATQSGDKGRVTVTTDQGTTTVGTGGSTVTEDELGLKFYPGATVKIGSHSESAGTKTLMVQLQTKASVKEVFEFYKKELGGSLAQSQLFSSDKGDAFFINKEGDVRWAVAGATEDGETVVTITRVEEAKTGS